MIMADEQRGSGKEALWVAVAIGFILIGVGFAIGHRMDYVPLWLGTTATVLTGLGAICAALIAARGAFRNDIDG